MKLLHGEFNHKTSLVLFDFDDRLKLELKPEISQNEALKKLLQNQAQRLTTHPTAVCSQIGDNKALQK
jgi:hypothetical protein